MIKNLRKIIPNSVINFGKHLPLAIYANLIYGFPSRKIKIIGVTGTDGKTTTVNMLYQILKDAGRKVSMVSTINAQIGNKSYDTGFHVTNPGPLTLQKLIKDATNLGSEIIILEVTSQGLVQFRTWGIKFDVGILTNITNEHLDYHKTYEKYLKAKAILFQNSKVAIFNETDKSFKTLKKLVKCKIITYGALGSDYNFHKTPIKLKIPGDYNRYNALASYAAALLMGVPKNSALKSLSNFQSLNGRMEQIENKRDIKIIVDFAHTPNALENALKTLKKETKGKLIAVFGCASERDDSKRKVMGVISEKYADVVVLTDEDPRFEDSMKIIGEISKDMRMDEGKTLFKIPDRFQAIKKALMIAQKGDTVGIFGKGHEKSMNYKGIEKPWSDQNAVNEILKNENKK